MNHTSYRIAPLLLVLAFSYHASAYAARLRYDLRVGNGWKTVTTLLVSGKVEIMGQTADLEVEHSGTTEQKVLTTNTDGSFVSSVSRQSDLKVKFGGMDLPYPPPPPVAPFTVSYSSLGKILKVEGLEGQSGAVGMDIGLLISAVLLELPSKDLKVGDAWEIVKNDPVPATTKGKLLEITKKDGREVAKIEFTRVITGDDLNKAIHDITKPVEAMEWSGPGMTLNAVILIDTASGIPIQCDGKAEINMKLKAGASEFSYDLKGKISENTTK